MGRRPSRAVQRLYLNLLKAGRLWAELAEADPTDEAAHRELMEEHFEAGRLHAAIRQFQRLRTILARELGVLPSRQTGSLYRRIVGTAASGWVRPGLVGRETEPRSQSARSAVPRPTPSSARSSTGRARRPSSTWPGNRARETPFLPWRSPPP